MRARLARIRRNLDTRLFAYRGLNAEIAKYRAGAHTPTPPAADSPIGAPLPLRLDPEPVDQRSIATGDDW